MTPQEPPFGPGDLPFLSVDGWVHDGPAAPSVLQGHPLAMADGELGPDEIDRARVTADDVKRIAAIDSDLVRTRAIAVAYNLLGRQLGTRLGIDRTNWWTWATWATVTIAFAIDPIKGWQPRQGPPRKPSAMRRVIQNHQLTMGNQFLAQANRYVFLEMGLLATMVEDAADALLSRDPDELERFLDTVEPTLRVGIFGQGRRELLHYGIAAMSRAAKATDPADRHNHLHVSNVAFFEYEQRRLQAYLEVLLSGRPLKKWIELRDVVTYGSGSPAKTARARFRGRLSTRFMRMQLPDEAVEMSDRTRVARPADIPTTLSPADRHYLERWTIAEGRARTAPVPEPDWRQLRWRMARIGRLFGERQGDPILHQAPYGPVETVDILRGLDPRNDGEPPMGAVTSTVPGHTKTWTHASLDELRRVGDLHASAPPPEVTPERLLNDELSRHPWPVAIDRWVRRHNHLRLHEMLGVVLSRHDIALETIDDIVHHQLLDTKPESLSWVAPDDVRAARAFFRMKVPAVGTGLVFGALPADIAAADGARVIHQSGYFLNEAPRRIQRTTKFVLDVMNTGIDRDDPELDHPRPVCLDEEAEPFTAIAGPTLSAIRRTRVTHQVVRSWIQAQPSAGPLNVWGPAWPDDEQPINVEDQLGTILSFTVALWDALRNLDIDEGLLADFEEPWYRTWCLVGVNLGIPADELPRSVADARELAHLLAARHLRPSQAGFELGQTLVKELRHALPVPWNVLSMPIARQFTSSAIRTTTQLASTDRPDRYPWSIAEMLALPKSRLIGAGVAKATLRSAIGEGPVGLPRTVLNRIIIRQYSAEPPRYGERPPPWWRRPGGRPRS